MLVEGVQVEYRTADGSIRGDMVSVVDFKDHRNNDWFAVNQFTVTENGIERRPDIVLFVNGLPLGIIELKNPTDENATIESPRMPSFKPTSLIFRRCSRSTRH